MIISSFSGWKLRRLRDFSRLPPDLPSDLLRDLGLPPRHDDPRIPFNRLF